MTRTDFTRAARRPLADGVVLVLPGPGVVSLCVKPGLTPLEPLHQIVDELLARATPRPRRVCRGTIERFVTGAGDEGGALSLAVELDRGVVMSWVVAMIVAGRAFTLIEGTGTGPRVRDLTLELARSLPAMGAAAEARWFQYQPPEGWLGVRRPLATVWLDGRRSVTVCDAVRRGSPVERTRDLLWPAAMAGGARRRSIEAGAVSGELREWPGGAAADLHDGRFAYRLVAAGADLDLVPMIASIAPPAEPPRCDVGPTVAAFEWMM